MWRIMIHCFLLRECLLLNQSIGATRALCRLLKRMLLPDGVSGVKALKLSFLTYAFNFTFAYLLAFSGVALPFLDQGLFFAQPTPVRAFSTDCRAFSLYNRRKTHEKVPRFS